MADSRYYDPALLWALACDYAQRQADAEGRPQVGPTDVQLRIYGKWEHGCFRLHGPKLYKDEGDGEHFTNCPQDALRQHAAIIGEVVLQNVRIRRATVLGKTFDQAITRLTTDWQDGQQPA